MKRPRKTDHTIAAMFTLNNNPLIYECMHFDINCGLLELPFIYWRLFKSYVAQKAEESRRWEMQEIEKKITEKKEIEKLRDLANETQESTLEDAEFNERCVHIYYTFICNYQYTFVTLYIINSIVWWIPWMT